MNKDIKKIYENYMYNIQEQASAAPASVNMLSEAEYKQTVDALAKIQEANEKFYSVAKKTNLLTDREIQTKRQNSSNSISKYIATINNRVDKTDTGLMQNLQQYVSKTFSKFKNSFTTTQGEVETPTTIPVDANAEDRIDVFGPHGKIINVATKTAKMLGMKPVATTSK